MNNVEILKVWVFYLHGEIEPYAITTVKEYKVRFLQERNPSCFTMKKVKMDELEFSMFSNNYRQQILTEFPLNTSVTDYVDVLMTPWEYASLNAKASELDSEMSRIRDALLRNTNLRDKYKSAIEYLTTTSCDGRKDKLSTINLLYLFMKEFSYTLEVQKK